MNTYHYLYLFETLPHSSNPMTGMTSPIEVTVLKDFFYGPDILMTSILSAGEAILKIHQTIYMASENSRGERTN